MLRGSTLGDTQQIIGEAADCSGWTGTEGQGGRVCSAVSCKIQTCNLCFTMLCKIQFWETGDQQLFHIQISAFQDRVWELIHKSMVVYLISNITVSVIGLRAYEKALLILSSDSTGRRSYYYIVNFLGFLFGNIS